jgi:predicted cytidylate kinase
VGPHLSGFAGDLKRSFLDLATIVLVIGAFQFLVLRTPPEQWEFMLLGLVVVGLGMALFMRGLEMGLFPVGEELARHFGMSRSRFWLMTFAFAIGFATTIAEPALIAVAHKAAAISSGAIDAYALRIVTAVAVGLGVLVGVLRIIWNHPAHWYIIGGYALTLAVTYFSPVEIVGLAYDLGGVTTSTVTVPLVAALGIGLATSLRNRNPLIDGFGIIAFASLTPMIVVQFYGIVAYSGVLPEWNFSAHGFSNMTALAAGAFASLPSFSQHFSGIMQTFGDLLPILLLVGFFQYAVLRQRVEGFGTRAFGFFLVFCGLYLFVLGLEVGLFPIGESIARALVAEGNLLYIYLFSLAIGYATTFAEPALTVIAQKAEDMSGGAMNAYLLRVLVSVGVGVGLVLGAYRIVNGDSIVLYIMLGYAALVLMTYFSPRTMIPVAYDAGGVTTSTIAVPIIAALGIGLATAIPGRDPLIDGFGLIAFSSLFPMMTVLGYGIAQQQNIRRHERYLAQLAQSAFKDIQNRGHSTSHLLREDKVKKRIITVTGTPGSGATTVSARVAELLHFRYFSSGQVFRGIAAERELTLDELNRRAEAEPHIDAEIDLLIRIIGEEASRIVINSRLGYHWIHSSFKVFLTVPPQVAAERTFAQIQSGGRSGEASRSVEEEVKTITKRVEMERERYLDRYGVDTGNMRPFNLVIDTENKEVDDVAREIVAAYSRWIGGKR